MSKDLITMMKEIRELNNKNGWFMIADIFMRDSSVTNELLCMQLELTKVLEAYRKNNFDSFKFHIQVLKLHQQTHLTELVKAFSVEKQMKTVAESFFLITSEISEAYEALVNRDLENLGEETADIFIRLLDICEHAGINLEAEYEKKMERNWKRSYRHGNKRV